MIELIGTPLSAVYYTPASLCYAICPIFSTVADFSTEKSSTINGSQVAGPNLGIRVATPIIAIFFVAALILVVYIYIIVYTAAKKSKNCKPQTF